MRIRTADTGTGPLERSFELQTNDSRHRLIKVTVIANVKPLPAFVKRVSNADIAHGERLGPFNVWPASQPVIAVERGERLAVTLRIRPEGTQKANLELASASEGCELKREANGTGYLLEMPVAPSNDLTPRVMRAALKIKDDPAGELALQLTINTQGENLTITPREINLGELSLANLQGALAGSGRIGLRKTIGSFRIKSLTSTLDFLKPEQRTIVEGSNYLIRISLDQTRLPKAASYTGFLKIETDDPQTPRVEVPIKMVLK